MIGQVSERISSASLTAAMEEKLAGIEQGEYSSAELREEIEGYLREDIPEVLAAPAIRPVAAAGEPGAADFKGSDGGVEVAQKKLTEAQVKALCGKKGRTGLIKGFVSKKGKKFDAFLVMDAEFKAQFEFDK